MDAARFDSLLRSLATSASRRGVLAGLTSGLLASLPFVFAEGAEARKKKKKKKKNKNKTTGGGSSPPLPAPPASLKCPQPANPHWCASASTCVPACPPGKVFDSARCTCECVLQTCCSCRGGTNPFCSTAYAHTEACEADCQTLNPNWTGISWRGVASNTVCTANGCADAACTQSNCEGADACSGEPGTCAGNGECFQPLGGGPTRCAAPTTTGSCGCTSHQQCADNHGAGAFCVQITGGLCTCNGFATFCAQPR